MRKNLDYMVADFKRKIDHIKYDARRDLDKVAEDIDQKFCVLAVGLNRKPFPADVRLLGDSFGAKRVQRDQMLNDAQRNVAFSRQMRGVGPGEIYDVQESAFRQAALGNTAFLTDPLSRGYAR